MMASSHRDTHASSSASTQHVEQQRVLLASSRIGGECDVEGGCIRIELQTLSSAPVWQALHASIAAST